MLNESMTSPALADPPVAGTADRLRTVIETLEAVIENRAILSVLSTAERSRLMQAAGEVYCPDVGDRRKLVKAKVRKRKADKVERDQRVLAQTGIRKLRQQAVFTTPNAYPPL